MSQLTYNVVLEGRTLGGREPAEVALALAKMFGRSVDNVIPLLKGGNATVIKRGVDETTALRFQNNLERAGAACRLDVVRLELDSSVVAPTLPAGVAEPAATISASSPKHRIVQIFRALIAAAMIVVGYYFVWPLASMILGIKSERPVPIVSFDDESFATTVSIDQCRNRRNIIHCVFTNKTKKRMNLTGYFDCYNAQGIKVNNYGFDLMMDPSGQNEKQLCYFDEHTPGKIVIVLRSAR